MSTQPAQTTTPTKIKPEKTKRERRSFNVRLDGPDGSSLRITAARKGDGAVTFVVQTTKEKGKKVNARGITVSHTTIEAAKAAQVKLVADATKLGWKVREVRRGFQKQEDKFSTLPAPGKTSSKK